MTIRLFHFCSTSAPPHTHTHRNTPLWQGGRQRHASADAAAIRDHDRHIHPGVGCYTEKKGVYAEFQYHPLCRSSHLWRTYWPYWPHCAQTVAADVLC